MPLKLARLLKSLRFSDLSPRGWLSLGETTINSKGNLRRWSAKNTAGGVLCLAAAESVLVEGVSWEAVALGLVGVLPLSLSLQKKRPQCRCKAGACPKS